MDGGAEKSIRPKKARRRRRSTMVIEALKAARDFIEHDRQALAESLTVNGEIVFEDGIDRNAMAEYANVLVVIDAALRIAGRSAPEQEPTIAACIIGANAVGKKIDGYEAAKVYAAMQKAMSTPPAQPAQEPVNLLEARKIAAEYGTPDSQVDNGNLYFGLSKCLEHIDAQPAPVPKGWPSDDLVTEKAKQSGFDLSPAPNMLYTVRGNHAQLVNFARAMLTTTPAAQPAPVPLTDVQITAISKQVAEGGPEDSIDRFVRAIETRHGTRKASHDQALPYRPLHTDMLREIDRLECANAELLQAISKTVQENLHLADGDNCTLAHLVRTLGPNGPGREAPLTRKELRAMWIKRETGWDFYVNVDARLFGRKHSTTINPPKAANV
jgi:hypothetical protein